MIEKKPVYYATAALLAILIFASDFLSTEIFKAGFQNFSVWFVLSLFAFACGWLINKTLGYVHGGKVVFAVIVGATFVSVVMISVFSDYFGLSDLLVESMILFTLRNITLGAMAFFGMAVCELIHLQKEQVADKVATAESQKILFLARKEAQNIVDDAKIRADKIVYDAQKNADEFQDRKNRLEQKIKEFITAEKELIKSYEAEED